MRRRRGWYIGGMKSAAPRLRGFGGEDAEGPRGTTYPCGAKPKKRAPASVARPKVMPVRVEAGFLVFGCPYSCASPGWLSGTKWSRRHANDDRLLQLSPVIDRVAEIIDLQDRGMRPSVFPVMHGRGVLRRFAYRQAWPGVYSGSVSSAYPAVRTVRTTSSSSGPLIDFRSRRICTSTVRGST